MGTLHARASAVYSTTRLGHDWGSSNSINGETKEPSKVPHPTNAATIPDVFGSVVEAILFIKRKPISRAPRIGPCMPIGPVAFELSIGTIFGMESGRRECGR